MREKAGSEQKCAINGRLEWKIVKIHFRIPSDLRRAKSSKQQAAPRPMFSAFISLFVE
jgi:hypothetical protein